VGTMGTQRRTWGAAGARRTRPRGTWAELQAAGLGVLLAAGLGLGSELAACSNPPASGPELPDVPLVDTPSTDADAADTVEPDAESDADVGADVIDGGGDAAPDIEPDVPPQCETDDECAGVIEPTLCENVVCSKGQCVAQTIPLCCEEVGDCPEEMRQALDVCEELQCVANKCTISQPQGCCVTDEDCPTDALNCCEVAQCDEASHTCQVTAASECCETSADCDDGNASTTDVCQETCTPNGCLHKAPLCDSDQVFASKNFDDGTLQLMSVLDANAGDNITWHTTSTTSVSPPNSLHLGDAACGTYYNGPMTACFPDAPLMNDATALDVRLSLPEVTLQAGAGAFLGFWVRMSAEPGYPGGGDLPPIDIDYLQVTVDDGSGPEVVWVSTKALGIENTTNGAWVYQTVGLSKYQGTVKIQFQFFADPTGNYAPAGEAPYEGVYLDDIVVKTTCASAFCDDATAACPSDGNGCTADSCTLYANEPGGVCAYQRAVLGESCQGCGQDADCGSDACHTYACVDNACQVDLKPECCVPSSVFPEVTAGPDTSSEGFEGGSLVGWAQDDPYPNDNVGWQVAAVDSHSGGWSLYFGDPLTGTYEASPPNPAQGTIWTPAFIVGEADFRTPVASFWLKLSTEWDGAVGPIDPTEPYDHLRVYVQEGVNDEPVEVWDSLEAIAGSTNGEWVQVGIDLTPFAGTTAKLGFAFDSGDPPNMGAANAFEGALIDDLTVGNVCGNAPCLGSADCDDGDACTVDSCEQGVCQNVMPDPLCCDEPSDCDDGNACTTDTCDGGTCSFAYDEAALPTCCSEGPWLGAFTEGFENGLGGFTVESDTPPVVWAVTDADAYEGTHSARFADPVAGNFQIPNQTTSGRLISPPVTVPAYGFGHSFARFALKMATEWDTSDDAFVSLFEHIDQLQVRVLVAGFEEATVPWTSSFTHNSTFGDWIETRVDLTDWAGQTIQLSFAFDSGDPGNNNFPGIFIDDVGFGTTCLDDSQIQCVDGGDCPVAGSCKLLGCDASFQCTMTQQPTPSCCVPANVPELGDDFEGGPGGWTFESCEVSAAPADPDSVWQITDLNGAAGILPKNGSKVLYFGNGLDYGGAQGEGSCGLATGPEIELEAGYPWTLKMWLFQDIEAQPSCDPAAAAWADKFQIELVDLDTGAATTIFDKSDNECSAYGSWVPLSVDLSPWAGKSVQLRLSFTTWDQIGNDGKGIAVDDIQFERGCP